MDTNLIVKRVRADLSGARRSQIERVADRLGIPRDTFRKIVDGRTTYPHDRTAAKIWEHYRRSRRPLLRLIADEGRRLSS